MEAYKHFNLKAPPFENRPNPRFYHAAAAHAEALATVQYAIHAGKACCILLGESGSGKTLLGRLVAEQANNKLTVLWIHGFGQPDDQTNMTVCPPGSLAGTSLHRRRPYDATLGRWVRSPAARLARAVVVLDNADRLPRHAWEDALALLTQDFRPIRGNTLVVLGLPDLLSRLTAPRLVRVWRRAFRICQLPRLGRPEVEGYIKHRLAVAGGKTLPFSTEALDLVHRFSGGNPALINQICDNALIDAYGDDRRKIQARHVVSAVKAIAGPAGKTIEMGAPSARQLTDDATQALYRETPITTRFRQLTADWAEDDKPQKTGLALDELALAGPVTIRATETERSFVPGNAEPPEIAGDIAPPDTEAAPPMTVTTSILARAVAPVAPAQRADAKGSSLLVERLRTLEVCITDALSRVREARSQRSRSTPPRSVASTEAAPAAELAEPVTP